VADLAVSDAAVSSDPSKKIKNLKKKLAQIQQLKDKRDAEGATREFLRKNCSLLCSVFAPRDGIPGASFKALGKCRKRFVLRLNSCVGASSMDPDQLKKIATEDDVRKAILVLEG
jgi:hypothetical protein